MFDFSWVKECSCIDDCNRVHEDEYVHSFHSLSIDDIVKQEKRLGCAFPPELREFYLKIGWGMLCFKDKEALNEIIDPEQLTDIIIKEGYYEGWQDDNIEQWDRKRMFPFFYTIDQIYFCLDLTRKDKDGRSPVVDPNEWGKGYTPIADSIDDFIRKMTLKTNYYYDIFEEL